MVTPPILSTEVLYIYIYLIQTVPCESTAEKISFGDTIRLESQSYQFMNFNKQEYLKKTDLHTDSR